DVELLLECEHHVHARVGGHPRRVQVRVVGKPLYAHRQAAVRVEHLANPFLHGRTASRAGAGRPATAAAVRMSNMRSTTDAVVYRTERARPLRNVRRPAGSSSSSPDPAQPPPVTADRPSVRPEASRASTAIAFGLPPSSIAVSIPSHGRDATGARWPASGPPSTRHPAIPHFPFQLA